MLVEKKVSDLSIEDSLKENGFITFKKGREFIEKYAYISIVYYNPKNNKEEFILDIDPILGCKYFNLNLLLEYENCLKRSLLLLGYIHNKKEFLFIDCEGKFYGAKERVLLCYGSEFEELIDNLIHNSFSKLYVIS